MDKKQMHSYFTKESVESYSFTEKREDFNIEKSYLQIYMFFYTLIIL